MGVHFCAGGVVLHNGKIAVLKRYNGVWLLPKGHIDPGETPEEAALREVLEETGLECEIVKSLWTTSYSYHEGGTSHLKTVQWYLMRRLRGRLAGENGMFTEARWIGRRKMALLSFDADRKLAKAAWDFKEGSNDIG
ncbi:MAG: NUDIX hydrolase [Bacillota bacterium]